MSSLDSRHQDIIWIDRTQEAANCSLEVLQDRGKWCNLGKRGSDTRGSFGTRRAIMPNRGGNSSGKGPELGAKGLEALEAQS